MLVYVICNQKGGVGKTATTRMLSSIYGSAGHRVLAIDLDQQCNLSFQSGVEGTEHASSFSVLTGGKIRNAIQHSNSGEYDIVPGHARLDEIDGLLASDAERDWKLHSAIADEDLAKDYDLIFIDCPPAVGPIVINALVAGDRVITPANPDVDAIGGILKLGENLQKIKKRQNPGIKFAGILLTMYNPRFTNSKATYSIAADAANLLGTKLFDTTIRHSVKISEVKLKDVDPVNLKDDEKYAAISDYCRFAAELCDDENK